jgi:hypothetical protein
MSIRAPSRLTFGIAVACGEPPKSLGIYMTIKQEMTVEEHLSTALQFLEHSGQEFAVGDVLQASEKLWGAASDAVIAVAKKRGWLATKDGHRKSEVGKLAQEYNEPSLTSGFSVAHKFHINFYRDFMEDDDVAWDRPIVERFVRRVVEIAEEVSA